MLSLFLVGMALLVSYRVISKEGKKGTQLTRKSDIFCFYVCFNQGLTMWLKMPSQ